MAEDKERRLLKLTWHSYAETQQLDFSEQQILFYHFLDVLEVNISPISATVIIGQNQTISCTVTGIPLATSIIWEFTPDGGTHSLPLHVEDSSGKYTGGSVHNPSLTITNFQPDDAGSYVCFAFNAVGVSSCSIPSIFEYTGKKTHRNSFKLAYSEI